MRVWMLCEAFALTGDATPGALPCKDRRTAMRELKARVQERVLENYEGCDNANEDIEADIQLVMNSRDKLGRGKYQYKYSADDREVVWRIYPCEVVQ